MNPAKNFVALAIAILALPMHAEASKAEFLALVRQLASTTMAVPCGASDWSAAADRLKSALAGWDAELREAESTAAQRRKGGSEMPAEHAALGIALAERGRFDAALAVLDAASLASPARGDLQLFRALTLEASGDLARASEAFARAWHLDERDPVRAYYALKRARLSDEDRLRAHTVLTDAYKSLSFGPLQPVSSSAQEGSPFPSINPLDDRIVPGVVAGDAVTGQAFDLLATQRFDQGVAALAAAARAAGNGAGNAKTECGAAARIARGRSNETTGRFAEARLEYAGAIAGTLIGRHVLHMGIGRLAQADGDFETAIHSFAAATRVVPNYTHAHTELATAYAAQGSLEDAFAELVAAVLIDPRDADAHAAIGQLFVDAERYGDAIPALTRALEIMPDRFERRYTLSIALARVGQKAEADRQLALFESARRRMLEQVRDTTAPLERLTPAAPEGKR